MTRPSNPLTLREVIETVRKGVEEHRSEAQMLTELMQARGLDDSEDRPRLASAFGHIVDAVVSLIHAEVDLAADEREQKRRESRA